MLLGTSSLIKVVPGLMIWTLVCFAITFYVLKRFAFARIQAAIDERRERIRQSIEEADRARSEAHKVPHPQRERIKQELDAERARRVEETRKEIEAETRRSIEQIRSEVADLTLEATSKVTGKVLDD